MVAKPKVWLQFLLVFIGLCALIGLSRGLRGMDFALALGMKALTIVASVILVWRMWRGEAHPSNNGWLALFPARMRPWLLGETKDGDGR